MEMFEYVAVLTSIIIGLGITHLLQGVARLIQQPGEAHVYWVHLAWVLYTFTQTIFWWWFEFRLGAVGVWTFQLYLFVVFYAVLIYLQCALLFPSSLDKFDGFRDYFYSRRAWFFGVWVLVVLVDTGDSWFKGSDHFSSLGSEYIRNQMVGLVFMLVAARTRSERFHAVWVVVALVYVFVYGLTSFGTVG